MLAETPTTAALFPPALDTPAAKLVVLPMIDVWNEQLLSLSQATRVPAFARCGRPIHVATVFRYVSRGVKARNGERVRLEVVKMPTTIPHPH
jgi:hypothetical protein